MKTFYIHQIYGLFEDGTSFTDNELFKENVFKWIYLITQNNNNPDRKYNYQYKLWGKKECDELIKLYPQFDYYHKMRFKIMKVDFIRFLILYHHAGLYIDMDVMPTISNIDFIFDNDNDYYVCKYVNKHNELYDIEILSSCIPREPLFYDYLFYIKSQIEEKDKIEIYENWKIRYIFQTTGPRAFNRFLKEYDKGCKNILSLNTILFEEGITKNNIPDEIINNYNNIQFYSFHSLSHNQEIWGGKYKGYDRNRREMKKKYQK